MSRSLNIIKNKLDELPNNIEAEQSVIGSILLTNKKEIMSFAIIQTGGKQYKVKTSDIIKIEKLDEVKSTIHKVKSLEDLKD